MCHGRLPLVVQGVLLLPIVMIVEFMCDHMTTALTVTVTVTVGIFVRVTMTETMTICVMLNYVNGLLRLRLSL